MSLDLANTSASTSNIYENVNDHLFDQAGNGHSPFEGKLEDSGTYDDDSTSCEKDSPSPDAGHESGDSGAVGVRSRGELFDDKHIYANVRDMHKSTPPVPSQDDRPRRNLNNGWMEFETDLGRTYFYNSETGRSQWIPPRLIRTPAEVQEFLRATKSEVDEFAVESYPATSVWRTRSLNCSKTDSQVEGMQHSEPMFLSNFNNVAESSVESGSQENRMDKITSNGCLNASTSSYDAVNNNSPPALTALSSANIDAPFEISCTPQSDEKLASKEAIKESEIDTTMTPSEIEKEVENEANRRKGSATSEILPSANFSSTAVSSSPSSMLSSFHAGINDNLGLALQNSSCRAVQASPPTSRSLSFKQRAGSLKNVPLPQFAPSTSSSVFYVENSTERLPTATQTNVITEESPSPTHSWQSSPSQSFEQKYCPLESREPMRTIKYGNMEKIDGFDLRSRKREWIVNYMYLTSAHLILYKDERSAEKHGKHYDAPLGVCDLKGATITWNSEKDKRKRKVIQLELATGSRYLLRTTNDCETENWFDALEDVIRKLPNAPPSSGLPMQPSLLDLSCAIVRNPSTLSTRPLSSSAIASKSSRSRRVDTMAMSAVETSTSSSGDEQRPSRETILEKLLRFFRNRPSVEALKEKGIYKPEPVFGSTLANICQLENSLVPKFIRTVTELIETKGLDVDGLYRVSGNLSSVQRIRCQVDQDKYNALVNEEDVHVLTGSLKLFFRELAEPVFPLASTKDFLSANQLPNQKQRFKKMDELLKALPIENRETLKLLIRHLNSVASHSDKNRMQIHNLAIMFGPTLFSSGEEKPKKKDEKKKKSNKKEETQSTTTQSNSHMAFNLIMQGQIVEFLLKEHKNFEALQGPILYHPL